MYWAPEVVNDNITNAKTDLFAVGMSLFQLANNISNLHARITSLDAVRLGRVISIVGYKNYFPAAKADLQQSLRSRPSSAIRNRIRNAPSIERLHVEEDWGLIVPGQWRAQIGNQRHEMILPSMDLI